MRWDVSLTIIKKYAIMDLSNYQIKKTNINSDRAYWIDQFVTRLNSERGKYKPLSPKFVAIKMSCMKTDELKVFYGECNYGKNFSATWWYKLDPKNY